MATVHTLNTKYVPDAPAGRPLPIRPEELRAAQAMADVVFHRDQDPEGLRVIADGMENASSRFLFRYAADLADELRSVPPGVTRLSDHVRTRHPNRNARRAAR